MGAVTWSDLVTAVNCFNSQSLLELSIGGRQVFSTAEYSVYLSVDRISVNMGGKKQ
jgi:hypothetical protein